MEDMAPTEVDSGFGAVGLAFPFPASGSTGGGARHSLPGLGETCKDGALVAAVGKFESRK